MSGSRKRVLVYALVVLLFAGLAAFYLRPMAANPGGHVLGHAGEAIFNIYIIAWSSHALGTNPLNLYNTTMFFPNSNTLAYTDNEFMSTLLALPVTALTRNPVAAYNWAVFLSFVLSAMGAYLLVEHVCEDRLAAFAGGVIFGFPILKMHHIAHLQVISTAALPLAILCLHLYTERKKPRYAFLFAAFAVAAFWTAWSYGFFLAYAVLLYLVVLLVIKRAAVLSLLRGEAGRDARAAALKWAGFLALAAAVIVMVLIPFMLPYLRIQKSDPGFYRNIAEVEHYSPDVKNLFVAPPESAAWGAATSGLRSDNPEQAGFAEQGALFLGLMPLLLAVAGVAALGRRGSRGKPVERFSLWYYTALMLTAGALSFGVTLRIAGRTVGLPMPYRLLYHLFPGFKSIRTPGRMFVLVLLAASVLAGFGVRWARRSLERRGRATAGVAVALLLAAVLTVEMMPGRLAGKDLPGKDGFPPVYGWLASLEGDAPAVALPLPRSDEPGALDKQDYFQLEPNRLYYNTANWKPMVNGYSGYLPRTYYDAAYATRDFPSDGSIDFLRGLGVRYVVVDTTRYSHTARYFMLNRHKKDPEFRLVKKFDKTYVFAISGQV